MTKEQLDELITVTREGIESITIEIIEAARNRQLREMDQLIGRRDAFEKFLDVLTSI